MRLIRIWRSRMKNMTMELHFEKAIVARSWIVFVQR